jgi:hypothetical protein
MTKRPLNDKDNSESIKDWLNENLSIENSLKPHSDEMPNLKTKGIYFWFMHPDGYDELSKYVDIKVISPKVSKCLGGVEFDLVYVGTSGTGKQGNSTLNDRLKWHLEQSHSSSNICHGTLSTLRTGLSSILSDDIILTKTEELVNDFMTRNMRVFWIEYPNEKKRIDGDEKILINEIRPLLNIKNNPNAKGNADENSTKLYRRRRLLVLKNTRLRLQSSNEIENSIQSNKQINNVLSYNDQIISEDLKSIEYTVSLDQDIAEVTRGIDIAHDGKFTIEICNSMDPSFIFDLWTFQGTKDVVKYFLRNNTKEPYLGKRSNLIKQWMTDNQMEEITVRINFN